MTAPTYTYQSPSGICPKCGRPYTYVGDYFGQKPEPWCTCNQEKVVAAPLVGWICSKCGGVYSPYVMICPNCQPKVTTTNKTSAS